MLEAVIYYDVKDGDITKNTINGISKLLNATFNIKNKNFVVQFDDNNQYYQWIYQNTTMFPKECSYVMDNKND